ncbi:MAG: hypothetical protein ABSH52_03595 [Terriglobia bacterium]
MPSEIGAFVRKQGGSATETILAIASDVYKRRERVTLSDPGPGQDRLKIRLEPRALRFIRAATRSRNSTSAIRKLLLWGYEARALPASPSRRFLKAGVIPVAPVAATLLPGPSVGGESWAGVEIPAAAIPAHPSRGMALTAWQGGAEVSSLPPSDCPPELPAPVSHTLEAIPVRVLAIGLPIALMVGAYFFLKWVSVLTSAGKVAAGVATAAKVAPSVATWAPQAAAGLGALFL